MAKLPLVLSPNPLLKSKSLPVTNINKEFQIFLDNMLETMYHQEGAGIAAVQVGVLQRVFILDIDKKEEHEEKNPIFFINPEIIYQSEEESVYNEGCLSFPGARSMIYRPKIVKVRYLDYDGNAQEMEADDYMARGILHENDHLNGITMPDHMSAMKKDSFLRHVKKFIKTHDLK